MSHMKRNFMRVNKGECRVLHLGRNKCIYQYRLVAELLEEALQRRTWGSWWATIGQ